MRMQNRYTIALAALTLTSLPAVAGADDERVTLDQVPAAVRATIERESAGGKVEEIEREADDGKTVYEVEIEKDDKEIEIHVAEDGKILKRDG